MDTLIYILIRLLDVYLWLIIANIIISWLVVFDVINLRNRVIYTLCNLVGQVTGPVMERVRRVVPPLGGIDLTPMVVMFGVYLLQGLLYSLLR